MRALRWIRSNRGDVACASVAAGQGGSDEAVALGLHRRWAQHVGGLAQPLGRTPERRRLRHYRAEKQDNPRATVNRPKPHILSRRRPMKAATILAILIGALGLSGCSLSVTATATTLPRSEEHTSELQS